MPGMDGAALLSALRKAQPQTPVIMMTALSQPTDVDRALKLGVVDYLVKPLDPAVLIAKVKEALHRFVPTSNGWTGPNRRQFVRGSIFDLDLEPLPGGKGIDISEGGISWRTKAAPTIGDVVVLEAPVLFAEVGIGERSLRGRVVYVNPVGLGYHRVGATLIGLTAGARDAIRAYVLARQARSALP